jgi:hypothetical protein
MTRFAPSSDNLRSSFASLESGTGGGSGGRLIDARRCGTALRPREAPLQIAIALDTTITPPIATTTSGKIPALAADTVRALCSFKKT